MKVTDLEREINGWEMRRANRLHLERQFKNFTGLIHDIELHCPYTQWEYVDDMLKEAKKYHGEKILFSGGDSVNLDMFSVFYSKDPRIVPARKTPLQELEDLVRFFKIAKQYYTKIIMLLTNHERRLQKVVMKNFKDQDQARAILKQTKTLDELFDERGLHDILFIDDFFFMVGDSMWSHWEENSAVPGSFNRKAVQYLVPRIQKQWSVCFQNHTHTQSKMPLDRKLIIETGACVQSLDYWRPGKFLGKGKMSTLGYAHGILKNGLIDIKTADFVPCGWEDYL